MVSFITYGREALMQTQVNIEERKSVQAISITNEQDIQTEQVGIEVATQTDSYINLAVNEGDDKLIKFVAKFYNEFQDNEEAEEIYNEIEKVWNIR
jgi:hypothetical protein